MHDEELAKVQSQYRMVLKYTRLLVRERAEWRQNQLEELVVVHAIFHLLGAVCHLPPLEENIVYRWLSRLPG